MRIQAVCWIYEFTYRLEILSEWKKQAKCASHENTVQINHWCRAFKEKAPGFVFVCLPLCTFHPWIGQTCPARSRVQTPSKMGRLAAGASWGEMCPVLPRLEHRFSVQKCPSTLSRSRVEAVPPGSCQREGDTTQSPRRPLVSTQGDPKILVVAWVREICLLSRQNEPMPCIWETCPYPPVPAKEYLLNWAQYFIVICSKQSHDTLDAGITEA